MVEDIVVNLTTRMIQLTWILPFISSRIVMFHRHILQTDNWSLQKVEEGAIGTKLQNDRYNAFWPDVK
jgi:hypothetical protein